MVLPRGGQLLRALKKPDGRGLNATSLRFCDIEFKAKRMDSGGDSPPFQVGMCDG